MTNKNLFNLLRSKFLTKMRHLQNLFLRTVTTTDIDIFDDSRSVEFHVSNSRQFFNFFHDTPIFFLEASHVIHFSNVKSKPRYRLRYRLLSLYQNINSQPDVLSNIGNMLFFIPKAGFVRIFSNLYIFIFLI